MSSTDRWDLTVDARCTVDGVDYVVYNDGQYRDAVKASAYDEDVADDADYSLWCTKTCIAVDDTALLARIFRAAKIEGGYSGAVGVYVDAAE